MNVTSPNLLQLVPYTHKTGKPAKGRTHTTEKYRLKHSKLIKSSQKGHKMTKTCIELT